VTKDQGRIRIREFRPDRFGLGLSQTIAQEKEEGPRAWHFAWLDYLGFELDRLCRERTASSNSSPLNGKRGACFLPATSHQPRVGLATLRPRC
jgi:hypothetical protein